jgi:hypothetical protein
MIGPAIGRVGPNHSSAGAVRLGDHGGIGNIDPGRDRRACTASTLQAYRVVLLLCPRLPNFCAIQKLRCGVLLKLARPSSAARSGPIYFGWPAACMGLEGLVWKHRDRPYRGGRQKHWIKAKNRSHPAMDREL